jgi:NADH-quinone oxidoreductase subunit J
MTLTMVVLVLTLLSALCAVMMRGLIRAVLGLAATSIFLTILMFMLGANLAAVFELSVCSGLITVVFISTISMTQPSSQAELREKTSARLRRYWYLPVILVVVGAGLAFFAVGLHVDLPPPTEPVDVRDLLWKMRQTDLLGQVVVILAGVFGVITLFKERTK